MCEACGNAIKVAIFRGERFCSDNCRRTLGIKIRDSHKS